MQAEDSCGRLALPTRVREDRFDERLLDFAHERRVQPLDGRAGELREQPRDAQAHEIAEARVVGVEGRGGQGARNVHQRVGARVRDG